MFNKTNKFINAKLNSKVVYKFVIFIDYWNLQILFYNLVKIKKKLFFNKNRQARNSIHFMNKYDCLFWHIIGYFKL
jgi:hypothetical protein